MRYDVDDLEHPWPPDVLHYETRYIFGLTMNELLLVSLPAMAVTVAAGPLSGALAAVVGLLSLKRYEAFANRSVPAYLVARVLIARRRKVIMLPLVLPAGGEEMILSTWDDEELLELVGDQE